MCCLSFWENKWVVNTPHIRTHPRYVIVWRELAIWLLTYSLWKTVETQKKVRVGGWFPSCLKVLHVHNKDTESTIQLLWRNINKIFIYIEKGTISCFLCVVNLFNEARKGYRFSRVYLLRFSKGQFEPCDIHLNNNNIGRRVGVL